MGRSWDHFKKQTQNNIITDISYIISYVISYIISYISYIYIYKYNNINSLL